jgi:uncharacterized protein YjdB
MKKHLLALTAALAAIMAVSLALLSCGGGGGKGSDDPKAVTGITMGKSSTRIDVGATERLLYLIQPTDATDKRVAWSSDDANVATVSDNGTVAAFARGVAKITVKTNDGGKEAFCMVTVIMPVASVSVVPNEVALQPTQTRQLYANVLPTNADDNSVTWSSSATNIATVSSSGMVTAVAIGTATVTATTNNGGKTGTCAVTVATNSVSSATSNGATLKLTRHKQ